MSANVETMAYSRRVGVPWHGLGEQVENGSSPEEMARAAKVDWRVRRAGISIREFWTGNTETRVPLMVNDNQMYAIVRETDGRGYQTCTSDYKPLQNVDMIGIFKEFCDAGELEMSTVGSLGKGNIIWALASVNHGSDVSIGTPEDKMKGYVLLANSHDGKMSFIGKFTEVCVVCNNTFNMAMRDGNSNLFSINHRTRDMKKRVEHAKEVLGSALAQQNRAREVAQFLADTPTTKELTESYIYQLTTGEKLLDVIVDRHGAERNAKLHNDASLLDLIADTHVSSFKPVSKVENAQEKQEQLRKGKHILESIVSSPGSELASRKDTWWGAFNGVTHYVDHVAGRSRDTALKSAWFGPNSKLKSDALELATQYAMAVQENKL